jgi:hypothetical protein
MEPEVSLPCNNRLPLVPILRQMQPIHIFSPNFTKIHSNIMFPSTPRSSKWLFPSAFPTNLLYAFLISPPCYIRCHLFLHFLPLFVYFSLSFFLSSVPFLFSFPYSIILNEYDSRPQRFKPGASKWVITSLSGLCFCSSSCIISYPIYRQKPTVLVMLQFLVSRTETSHSTCTAISSSDRYLSIWTCSSVPPHIALSHMNVHAYSEHEVPQIENGN